MSDTWKWLDSTRELQITSYGSDPSVLEDDALADFVVMNVLAATDELHEFLQEIMWKSWVSKRGMKNRDAAVGELVDAAHFIANLAVAMRCDDDEWECRYKEKQSRNAARQREGYTGLDKCLLCHRDYGESQCRPGYCAQGDC